MAHVKYVVWYRHILRCPDLMRCRKKSNIENDDRFAYYIDWSNIDYALLIPFCGFGVACYMFGVRWLRFQPNSRPSSAMVTLKRHTKYASMMFIVHIELKLNSHTPSGQTEDECPLKVGKNKTTIWENFSLLFVFGMVANSGMLGHCR